MTRCTVQSPPGPLSLLRPPRTRSMSSGGGSEPYGRFVDLRLLAMVYILP
ncbi:MAG: hypothetical protein HHJ14_05340 [Cellulomonas sp.]|nr:hypothetical protein [Cellulomonas sp.]NMM31343.1 hypothetical protein [Cellulomonas sp.]